MSGSVRWPVVALTAFTRRGGLLAQKLAAALAADGCQCELAFGKKLAAALASPCTYDSLTAWVGAQFGKADALVFVGASGIAVRAIAPYVRDKFTDPAVVSVDEAGRFAVPLLSGHVGGANELACRVAALTGGAAAVSTATDVNGVFAVDLWAMAHGLTIAGRELAKEVSAVLLDGGRVGFASDFAIDCPPGLHEGPEALGVWVTAHTGVGPFPRTLRLVPKCLNIGIGCRRGTAVEAIRAAVALALQGDGAAGPWDPAAVRAAGTIDLKKDEPGLLAFCRELGVALTAYTPAQLQAAEGTFTPSEFVRGVTGVDNVCERAAVLLGGTLVVPKRAGNGVTVAVSLDAGQIGGRMYESNSGRDWPRGRPGPDRQGF